MRLLHRPTICLIVLGLASPLYGQGSSFPNQPQTTQPSAPTNLDRQIHISDGHGQQRVLWERRTGAQTYIAIFREVVGTIFTRQGGVDSLVWDRQDGGKFYGNVEVQANGHVVKVTDIEWNQEKLYRDDGSWEWTLSSRDTLDLTADADPEPRPVFTLFASRNEVRILDHSDNRIYWTDATIESNRVTRDLENSDYTFVNSEGLTVTIHPDGSRSLKSARGQSEIDAGGRIKNQFNAEGKLTHRYHYGRTSDGKVQLDQYENNTGLWNLRNPDRQHNEKMKWELQNPLRGPKVTLESDRYFVNRQNELVAQSQPSFIQVSTTDGTVVTSKVKDLAESKHGLTRETTIEAKQFVNGRLLDYLAMTEITDAKGKSQSKTLKSPAGLFRSQDGRTWERVDQDGIRIEGSQPWLGDITIATAPGTLKFSDGRVHHYSSGALIRHHGSAHEDLESSVDAIDERKGQPRVTVLATSGIHFTKFPDGAEVVRGRRGETLSARYSDGTVYIFDTEITASGKRLLAGLAKLRNDHDLVNEWKWKSVRNDAGAEIGGYFQDRDGNLSFTKLELSGSGQLVERTEGELGNLTTITHHRDGTTTIKRDDTVNRDGLEVVLDPMGRIVQILDSFGWVRHDLTATGERVISTGAARIQYDDQGRIALFDSPAAVVVTDKYQPTAERPLPSDREIIHASGIEFEGIGDYCLTYTRKNDGHTVTTFPDGRLREYAIFSGESRLVRSQEWSGDQIAITRDDDGQVQSATRTKADGATTTVLCTSETEADARPDPLESPTDIRVAKGEILALERDKRVWIQFQNPDGLRVELLTDGAEFHWQQVGEQWHLVFAKDRKGKESRFAYSADGKLQSATGSDFELARDSASGLIQGRVGDSSGDTGDSEQFLDFHIGRSAGTYWLTIDKRLGRDQKTAQTIFDLYRGSRINVDMDGVSEEFDHLARPIYESYADGTEIKHVYLDDGGHRKVGSDGSICDYQLGPDGKERVFYRKTSSGDEYRTVYNDTTGSRTEIAPGGVIKDYIIDKAGHERIVYEKDAEGNETKRTFDLDEGRSVEHLPDGATTGFDKDGRVLYHIDKAGNTFNHFYNDDGAKWVEGTEEEKMGAKHNSKVVFDTAGRLTHKQEVDGQKMDFFYFRDAEDGNLQAEDYIPIAFEDLEHKWQRGESMADGFGNIQWAKRSVKDPKAKAEEWIGVVEFTPWTNPNDVRSTIDAGYKLITREAPANPPEVEVPSLVIDRDDAGRITRTISADRVTTTEYEWDGDELKGVTRTIQNPDKPSRTIVFQQAADGTWTAGQDAYDKLWVDSQQGTIYLKRATTCRQLMADGTEIETISTITRGEFWKQNARLSQVVRNTRGQVHSVRDSQGNTTVFGANSKGEIISAIQGSSGLIKRPDGAWTDPLQPGKLIQADCTVDHSGRQVWKGQNSNPIVREVAPDGTVTVTRLDGEKTVYSADGVTITHVPRSSSAVKQIVTNDLDEIRVELRNGSIYQQNLSVASERVTFIDPDERVSQIDGRLRVFEDGEVHVALPAGTTVYRSDGTHSQLATDAEVARGSASFEADRRLEVLRWGVKTKDSLRRGMGWFYPEANRNSRAEGLAKYQKAAEQGDVEAQWVLGMAYSIGPPEVEKVDLPLARKWLGKAAAQGDAQAKRRLEVINAREARESSPPSQSPATPTTSTPTPVRKFPPVVPSQAKPHPLFEVAEKGDSDAQFQLGLHHFQKQEFDEAKKWWTKAADQGHRGAKVFLKKLPP